MTKYEEYIARKAREYGDKFSPSALAPQFVRYFNSGERIRVRTEYAGGHTHERTGRVGVTTGWQPVFLLMHRSSDHGSSDTLGAGDEVIAVQHGREYRPVTP